MTGRARTLPTSTQSPEYAERLQRLSGARWKRLVSAQAPYRWNVRRLRLGWTLDVGCGIGRNLAHLDGHGVGVDHNPTSVAAARDRGLLAYTPDDFRASQFADAGAFDSLLAAHLIEHLEPDAARDILDGYLKYVQPGGLAVFITPQEKGYASDPTHIAWSDFEVLRRLAVDLGLQPEREYSFPFPRGAGRRFRYNEFVLVARLP
ncbi:MAG TPA: class I SAM-dependent methyltransferase [Rugosimonospora sp.]|nr:class I SAM-dependent methyltransferase [Rugosimonospora sp.]